MLRPVWQLRRVDLLAYDIIDPDQEAARPTCWICVRLTDGGINDIHHEVHDFAGREVLPETSTPVCPGKEFFERDAFHIEISQPETLILKDLYDLLYGFWWKLDRSC